MFKKNCKISVFKKIPRSQKLSQNMSKKGMTCYTFLFSSGAIFYIPYELFCMSSFGNKTKFITFDI